MSVSAVTVAFADASIPVSSLGLIEAAVVLVDAIAVSPGLAGGPSPYDGGLRLVPAAAEAWEYVVNSTFSTTPAAPTSEGGLGALGVYAGGASPSSFNPSSVLPTPKPRRRDLPLTLLPLSGLMVTPFGPRSTRARPVSRSRTYDGSSAERRARRCLLRL
ncbi:hypothetical protein EKO27_g2439 [Xylaria grammica]|uniref:Uncharacterized protein n=1 Tax=Xylaria grammica TaxID=363999 RepID=A0A439DE24_9PEZI|nr:hypothetical protein EKO27_g2439 [Xylaria grammica]